MESDRVHESLMLTIKGHGDYLEALMHEVDPDPDAIEVTQNYLSGTLDLLAIELFGNEPIFIH
jgi:hypothetical protein